MSSTRTRPDVRKDRSRQPAGHGTSPPKSSADLPVRLAVGPAKGAAEGETMLLTVLASSPADPGNFSSLASLWDEADTFGARGRMDTTLAIGILAASWNPLRVLLEAERPDSLALTDEQVTELLDGAGRRLEAAGTRIEWDQRLVRTLGSHLVLGAGGGIRRSVPDVFDPDTDQGLRWQLTLDGRPLTDDELRQVAESRGPVVRLGEQQVLVSSELAGRARRPELEPLSAIDALSVALTGRMPVDGRPVPVKATGWVARLRDQVTGEEASERVDPPAGLGTTLREYQVDGLRWLHRMTSLGLGGCLADDMGLGKTVMLIALHLTRRERSGTGGGTLVVCPASLLGNWEREVRRFAPGEPVRRYHGPDRNLDGIEGGFVLTTYGTMRRDQVRLAARNWDLVVADEAQHVKNPGSAGAQALRVLSARCRVALTGTPIENNLSDLWAILDWTTPGLLGNHGPFRRIWADPIESGQHPETARIFERLTRPFLLRRRKTDPGIAPELPPKTVTDRPAELTPEQVALYERVYAERMTEIRQSAGIGRRGLVLAMLTDLKQICNHPAQYTGEERPVLEGRSGKLALLDELLDTILAEGGAALVFTQYVTMARLLRDHLRQREIPTLFLHGGTAVSRREKLVDSFQAGEAPVFLLSLRAAGTGLNLTRADHVIHYDRWWNPAVEEQATDRTHRIGQTRPVQVHRLIAEGTIEDRIASIHESKRELADAVISGGDAALTELSNEDLAALVQLRNAGAPPIDGDPE